jgi:hypothetical protein
MKSASGTNTRAQIIRSWGRGGGSYHGGWIGAIVARSGSSMGVTHACNWGQIRLGRSTWRARRRSRRASPGGLPMPEAAHPAAASPISDGGTVYGRRSQRAPRLPLREGLGVFFGKKGTRSGEVGIERGVL